MENNNIIENRYKLFEKLEKSNDFEKVTIVDNISSDDLDLVYGFDSLNNDAFLYRLESLDRFFAIFDFSNILPDLVVRSHFMAIEKRIENLLCVYSKE